MKFLIFRRADSALLVVPALFQPPLVSRGGGDARQIAECEIDLDAVNPRLAADLAAQGFALLQGQEWASLEVALQLSTASAQCNDLQLEPSAAADRLKGDTNEA